MRISDWSSDVCSSDLVRLWCAKEAVLKAHGRGLAFGLDRLEFALRGDDWALMACDPALGRPSDWTLHAFTPMPGYLDSLAWRRSEERRGGQEGVRTWSARW